MLLRFIAGWSIVFAIIGGISSHSCYDSQVSVTLKPVASHRTYGNAGYEYFSIDSRPYLAVANFWDGQDKHMGAYSEILALQRDAQNGSIDMVTVMQQWTQGAHGVDYFEIPLETQENANQQHTSLPPITRKFLVFPNYYGCEGSSRPCKATTILKWNVNSQQFEFLQSLRSDGPSQSDHFSIPKANAHYLVLAENFANKVTIYRYHQRTNVFVPEQFLNCPGVAAIAVVSLSDRILLSAASYHDSHSQWQTRSPVFAWHFDGAETADIRSDFQLAQKLPTQGAHDVEIFDHRYLGEDGERQQVFMFFSEDRNQNGPVITSQIFQYDFQTHRFQLMQSVSTDGAHGAELFSVKIVDESLIFLAIANFGDRHGKRYDAKSALLMFSQRENLFIPVTDGISTLGATDWEHFEMDGYHYLAISNEGDLHDADPSELSHIYELVLFPCQISQPNRSEL